MSIFNDIRKVTQIPLTDRLSPSSFICHNTARRTPRTPRRNRRSPPQNADLYTEDDARAGDNPQECIDLPQKPVVHETEIMSFINEANFGVDYSNEKLEKHWRARQIKATLNSSAKTGSASNNTSNETEDIEGEEYWLRKFKLHKNAAIRGLLKTHKISLHDLQIPKEYAASGTKREMHTQNSNKSLLGNVTEEKYSMKLVQYPEDPEVYGQPLHVYGKLDENEYKDIDFTVPRIGKKSVVTPRQYYAHTDDTDFHFVKKGAKGKK